MLSYAGLSPAFDLARVHWRIGLNPPLLLLLLPSDSSRGLRENQETISDGRVPAGTSVNTGGIDLDHVELVQYLQQELLRLVKAWA